MKSFFAVCFAVVLLVAVTFVAGQNEHNPEQRNKPPRHISEDEPLEDHLGNSSSNHTHHKSKHFYGPWVKSPREGFLISIFVTLAVGLLIAATWHYCIQPRFDFIDVYQLDYLGQLSASIRSHRAYGGRGSMHGYGGGVNMSFNAGTGNSYRSRRSAGSTTMGGGSEFH